MDINYLKQLCVDFFTKILDFSSRTSRRDFWFTMLILFLANITIGSIPGIGYVLRVATFLPSLAIGARRLNDIGKSPYLLLLYLIPVVGWLILLYLHCKPGIAAYASAPSEQDQESTKEKFNLGTEMHNQEIKQEKSEFDKALDNANKELDDFLGTSSYDDNYDNIDSKSSNNKNSSFPI